MSKTSSLNTSQNSFKKSGRKFIIFTGDLEDGLVNVFLLVAALDGCKENSRDGSRLKVSKRLDFRDGMVKTFRMEIFLKREP